MFYVQKRLHIFLHKDHVTKKKRFQCFSFKDFMSKHFPRFFHFRTFSSVRGVFTGGKRLSYTPSPGDFLGVSIVYLYLFMINLRFVFNTDNIFFETGIHLLPSWKKAVHATPKRNVLFRSVNRTMTAPFSLESKSRISKKYEGMLSTYKWNLMVF